MQKLEVSTYNQAVVLIANIDDSFLELGRILRDSQEKNGLLFADLLKIPGLNRRAAYYLIEIDRFSSS
jgi:hypothetical protein